MPGIILFGDGIGLEALLPLLPSGRLAALVGAANRPQYQPDIEKLANSLRVPYLLHPPESAPAYADFERSLLELRPDLLLVYSYSMRIPDRIIAAPAIAAINIHGGPLPEYRGCNPIQWSIATGDNLAGASMHLLSREFDAGPLLSQRRTTIDVEETWAQVSRRVHALAIQLAADMMPDLLRGEINPTPQDESLARHWPRRRAVDSAIDWARPCKEIYDLIRASVSPLPGAFYRDGDGRKVVLDKFMPLSEVVRRKLEIMPYAHEGMKLACSLPPPCASPDELHVCIQSQGREVAGAVLSNLTGACVTAALYGCKIPFRTIVEFLTLFINTEMGSNILCTG